MTLEEFRHLSRSYNMVPVSRSILADMLTPVSAYLRLREESKSSFLFESVEGGERLARYSFIGIDPVMIVKCAGATTTIAESAGTRSTTDNMFEVIGNIISRYKQPLLPCLPRFTGGLVGCIGYDAIRFIEQIPDRHDPDQQTEHTLLGLFTTIIAFDHLKHQITIIVSIRVDSAIPLQEQYASATAELEKLESLLSTKANTMPSFTAHPSDIEPDMSPGEFKSLVLKAKEYILAGDIFQVVLSQRFSTTFSGDPFNVYRALRIINPSPYLYYLDFEQTRIIGSSPEVLVRLEDGTAEVYPIAGTRPRGATDHQDASTEKELLSDEKERAEHVMLVDLGRNDLGKVCEPGSVRVDAFMFTVRYSHVMHIASRVSGRVPSTTPCIDLLKATFPAGTVSGAPKIRAMEIIDELEEDRRGMYAGGIGYIDFAGHMDMCIAIRTIIIHGDRLFFQAGAGIVADSDPVTELNEILAKARALVEAIFMANQLQSTGDHHS